MSSDELVVVGQATLPEWYSSPLNVAPYVEPIVKPIPEASPHDCRSTPRSRRDKAGLGRGNTHGWWQRVALNRDGEGVYARAQLL